MNTIISIGTAVPSFKSSQDTILEFMSEYLPLDNPAKRKLNAIYHRSNISTRYSVLPDYMGNGHPENFFKGKGNRKLEDRMQSYHRHALPLSMDAIRDCLQNAENKIDLANITHLITVSCTGFSAPGLDIELIHHLGLSPDINRTSINFMGCYAAFHGLKLADAFAGSDKNAVVLVVCVELCTIHFQTLTDEDNLVANSLFSDGASAMIVTSATRNTNGLHIRKLFSTISPEGVKDMAWNISSTGFLMTLSSYIPGLIEKGIKPLAQRAMESSGLTPDDIQHWAIHPGGRKILEASAKSLGIDISNLESSFNILKNYGNMSSASILFVLKDLWFHHINRERKEYVFAAGFGPGLTIESAVLSTSA